MTAPITITQRSDPPPIPAKEATLACSNGLIEADVRRWALDWAMAASSIRDTLSVIWVADAISHFVLTGNVPNPPVEQTCSDDPR